VSVHDNIASKTGYQTRIIGMRGIVIYDEGRVFFKTSMIRKRHAKLSFLSVAQWVKLLSEHFYSYAPAFSRDTHEIGKL